MTPKLKAEFRRSELRSKLVELTNTADRTPEQNAELEKLTAEFQSNELEFRAAIAMDPQPEQANDRHRGTLEERAAGESWLDALIKQQESPGAMRELRSEMGLPSDHIPTSWLTSKSQMLEERASSPLPTTAQTSARPVLQRVFKPSFAMSLGITPDSVPASETSYPILSGGTSASMKAVDQSETAGAASFTTQTLLPKIARGRVVLRRSELATFPQGQQSLVSDLSMQIDDLISQQIATGPGDSISVQGLTTALTQATAPSAEATYADYLSLAAGEVDALHATSLGEVRLVVGLGVWRHSLGTYRASESEATAYDWMDSMLGVWNLSGFIPAAPSTGDHENVERIFGMKTRGMMGSYAFPIWQGTQMIVDPYSLASSGNLAITSETLFNFKVLRSSNFVNQQLKIA